MIKINKGLDLLVTGAPEQRIYDGPMVRSVALVGSDYVGMKPTMEVKEGDRVSKGQVIFTDKKTPGVKYTAPAAGVIANIHRGPKRVLLSVTIEVDGIDAVSFPYYSDAALIVISRELVVENLVNSGLWTAFRTRPFSKVPAPDSKPASIFVTAMDSNPLAADPQIIIAEHAADFTRGLDLIAKLSDGPTYLCKAPGSDIPDGNDTNIRVEEFSGPHPSGLVGTHIHFLDPVSENKTVWHIGYQDVIAVGKLFSTGDLFVDRVVSLAGPRVSQPRLVRTRLGASTDEITAGQVETSGQENRVISGSLLSGRTARAEVSYLGRYDNQVTVLQEDRHRYLLGYLNLGKEKHSVMNIFLSRFSPNKKFALTTTTSGSPRAIVPVGNYERVMPLDILPTQLLRALVTGDLEDAQLLGCLELDEEDVALCTYVCPGKYEFGPILRDNLNSIEKEG
jgi:Na+-transporting NADH:ubiquinone oxidoreductase subunit A